MTIVASAWFMYDCHHNTQYIPDVCTVPLSVLNTWALMPILKQRVCSMDREVCVEGRGKSVLRNTQDG